MSTEKEHIAVCVCTYKRSHLLKELLEGLRFLETGGLFAYSVVVADNDELRSAEQVVMNFALESGISVHYCVEPKQNIALTRNKAIECAKGDFIAFIDDDEIPMQDWLLHLFKALKKYKVDGVLGPVKPRFQEDTPSWVVKGKFYDRPTYPTGFVIGWTQGRTGNVLLKKQVFAEEAQAFRPQFRAGEDQDFFRRMIAKGLSFVWCGEAIAYEVVPPSRWRRRFMLRRALLRGATASLHPTLGLYDIGKSIVAIPLYTLVLPFSLLVGQFLFMKLLVKLCDHCGKLLALAGINLVKEPYVVE